MINRLYHIKGIRPQDQPDLISYLKSFPEFNRLETQIYLDSSDGGNTHKNGAISGSLGLSFFHWIVTHDNYLITITAALGEIYIFCEKITQELLFKKYQELKNIELKLAKQKKDLDILFKKQVLEERLQIFQKYKKRLINIKREIKQKHIELGIEVKPGSELSKLLRLNNIDHML